MAELRVPLEIEAKLAVTNEVDLRSIGALGQLGPFALQKRGTARLHSVYFDTAELILARHGIALRARRHGNRWEVTLKWAGDVSGAIHTRPELTEALAKAPGRTGLRLPAATHNLVAAYVSGRPLKPILVSDVRRDLVDVDAALESSDNEPLAEMALDRVLLRAPGERDARASYCELEIELKHGQREDIDLLARLLQERFDLAPSADTKFAHGMTLLHGPQLGAFDPPLGDGTVRVAAQRLIRRNLASLRETDPGTRLGTDPEQLHDMRVASRRLRSILRYYSAAFPAQRCEHLRSELRWLNRILSPVRDCDVQLETLHQYETVLTADRRRTLAPYREYILRQRDVHRAAMLATLDSKRYFSLLLRLEQFVDDRRPPRFKAALEPAADVGRKALKHAFKRLLRQGKGMPTTPKSEELHRIRIRGKRLRYLLEFFQESSGKPGERLLETLVRLQDLLGVHNDAMVAAAFLEDWVHGAGADSKPATLLTLGGFLQEEHRRARKARAKFHRTWERFASKRTVEDWKAVHRRLAREAAVVTARRAAQKNGSQKDSR